jgi:type I site-specific restriction endonuclease
MSVEFSNIYQEVLLENLDVIIKQNFIFQARLKLLEKEADVRAEMQAKINELTVKHQEALQQINNSQHYKVQAESNDAIVQEKTRIQSALNDTMRELGKTKSALELKEKEIEEMSLRISELEKLIPSAPKAVKKVTVKTVEEEKPVKISATETNKIRVEAGGTF